MATTQELLRTLDQWLRRHRPAYYKCLQPPLSQAQLAHLEASLGVSLPVDFKDLYQWKAGQSGVCFEPLFGEWSFMRATEIQAAMQANNELLEMGAFHGDAWWNPRWLPILTDPAGNLLCLDLEGAFGGKPGQLVAFWHDNPERAIEYPDIPSFLSALLEGFEAGLQKHGLSEPIELPHPRGYPVAQGAR